MDEVLADTLGAIIEAVNKQTNLGITMEGLNGKKLKHMIPEHDGLVREILNAPGFLDSYQYYQLHKKLSKN